MYKDDDMREKAKKRRIIEEIVVPFSPRLNRMIAKYNIPEEDAKILTQETIEKIYYNLDSLRKMESIENWMLKIAANTAKSYLRKIRSERKRVITEGFDLEEVPSNGSDGLEEMLKEEKKELIREAFDILTPDYKTILWLRYVEEKRFSEIEDILELNGSTVRMRAKRGKEKLASEYLKLERRPEK